MSAGNTNRKLDYNELIELNNQLDRQLEDFTNKNKSTTERSDGKDFSWKKIAAGLLLLIMALIVPFLVLIRTSIYLYFTYHLNGWAALAAGVVATALLLLGYVGYVSYRYRNRFKIHRYMVWGVVILVTAYTVYGALYYSSLNTKTDEINRYYRSLHPIVRVALTTITLADSDLLVTDIHREPADYARMGLPENRQSLHYVQSDGFVHAVDLRTKGRPEWQNQLMEMGFKITGLQSIRHVGNADHLHIYLPLNE